MRSKKNNIKHTKLVSVRFVRENTAPSRETRFLRSIVLEVGLSEKAQIFSFGTDPKSSKEKQFAVGLVFDALEIVLRINALAIQQKRGYDYPSSD